jgi:CheY-like chemotaxis protein
MRRIVSRPTKSSIDFPDRDLVLYVEDDDDNWEVAKLRLSRTYELVRAATAEEACRVMRERGHEIDVILMDIELRGSDLNGVDLTRIFRGEPAANADVPLYARNIPPTGKPVVFVTAHGAKHTRVQLMLAGAEQIIAKPVNFQELTDAIAELTQDRTNPGELGRRF